MTKPFKIGIAGLGTVGVGTFKLLTENRALIANRCERPFEITAVSAATRDKDRGIDISGIEWFDDGAELASKADVDVVVEVIGGSDGIAKRTVEEALSRKIPVVTANKALLAHHGFQLAKLAEDAGVGLAYEAAVAGGVPIIKAIREGLAGNSISKVTGILNGTCNYILSTMRTTGRGFEDVLKEAQDLGYAEADPTFDVDGVDAAHKLAILTSVAFGTIIDFDAVHVEGIRNISPLDISYADEFGYRIKLLGVAEQVVGPKDGGVVQRVYPCLVKSDHPLAPVEGVFNAISVEGNFVGKSVYEGQGAGAGPTASAIVADIIDVARGLRAPVLGVPVEQLKTLQPVPIAQDVGDYYVRLLVVDRPGVLADISSAFRDEGISIESVLQRGRHVNVAVNVVIITHETLEEKLARALERLKANDALVEPPHMMRIEGREPEVSST